MEDSVGMGIPMAIARHPAITHLVGPGAVELLCSLLGLSLGGVGSRNGTAAGSLLGQRLYGNRGGEKNKARQWDEWPHHKKAAQQP
jgi:hypothetical protein